jgi:Flp pilus assembly protein TadD
MWKAPVVLLAAALALVGAGRAEDPPWKRMLTGDNAKKAAVLEQQIRELEAAGKFAEAVQPASALLALRQPTQGDRHWQTADAARKLRELKEAARLPQAQRQRLGEAVQLNAEAANLYARGNYTEAEPLYRKVLAVREEMLGPKHSETATSYNNLGATLQDQGKARDAEQLLRKALAIREEVLGPQHPDTATSYNDLAFSLDEQGKAREAEPLLRKALVICEEVRGPQHPDTARSYNNLAFNLDSQGQTRDAEPLLRKALLICEVALGPKHPNTATCYNNLARNLDIQGKTRDAEALLRKALALCEEVLGPQHPDTAMNYNNLALNLTAQGQARSAEPLYRKALAVREKVLGPKHPYTATTYSNLAFNLLAQGRPGDAEPLLRKATAISEESLGPEHPDTAQRYHNLASFLDAQGKTRDAEPLFRKALAVREKVLGPKHPLTASTYNNLASCLALQGKMRDVEPLYRKALAICEAVLGPQHPDTATSYNNLALTLYRLGKVRDAEPYWGAAVEAVEAARLRLTGSGFNRAAATKIAPHQGLALSLARQGKAAEAWHAAERGLARGLLDDLGAVTVTSDTPDELRRLHARAARLEQLEKALLPLLTAENLNETRTQQRDELSRERNKLQQEIAAEAAERAGREVVALESLQQRLLPDAALVFWADIWSPGATDPGAFHYACLVRCQGAPAWVRLPGCGSAQAWTDEDDTLPQRLREALAQRSPAAAALARQLYAQRLEPLMPHLAATATLPTVKRLIAVPAGAMAGIPLEALTDRYALSYVPSASVFVRQAANHRPLREPTLLALGDPAFTAPETKRPEPPGHGLLALQVLAAATPPGPACATTMCSSPTPALTSAGWMTSSRAATAAPSAPAPGVTARPLT